MVNQLFQLMPKINILYDILNCIGLNDLKNVNYFCIDNLKKLDSVKKIYSLKLQKYYLPCKTKIYLNNLNEKKIITILRHFLKLFNYKLISKEKYINKKKK